MSYLLKNQANEQLLFRGRLLVALALVFALFGVLFARVFYLQVLQNDRYTTLSRNNHMRLLASPPTRGRIYDRHGRLLADNQPAFRIDLIPEQLQAPVEEVVERLGERLALRDSDKEAFYTRFKRAKRFERIPLRLNVSEEEMAQFIVDQYQFPGVEVSATLVRTYPYGPLFAHTVGYVGRISEADLEKLDAKAYEGTNYVGKIGIEQYYEDMLHGSIGYVQAEIDAHGRLVRESPHTTSIPGDDLILTLDVELQQLATDLLAEHRGALVAIDPRNGEVLALVSHPTFDANLFVGGISQKDYQTLQSAKGQPLFNRAIQGQYPPASTIKPFIGLAGLQERLVDTGRKIYDPGYYQLNEESRQYKDWKRQGHGWMDLNDAIAQSCDTYFYVLAHEMGIDHLSEWLKSFGFGAPTLIDLPGEQSGLMPTREWKKRVKGEPWYIGETLITGIGQGFMMATPLQLATATATMANRGKRFAPYLVKSIHPATKPDTDFIPQHLKGVEANAEHWDVVIEAMEATISSPYGTAHRLHKKMPTPLAGKTGTAQVFGLKEGEEYDKHSLEKHLHDHSLFTGFAPTHNPEIAIAVIIENNSGSTNLAHKVLKAYFEKASKSEPSVG